MVSTEEQVRRINILMHNKNIATNFLSNLLSIKVVDVEFVEIPYTGYFENPIRPVDVKVTFDNGETAYVQILVNKDEEMMYQNSQYSEQLFKYAQKQHEIK